MNVVHFVGKCSGGMHNHIRDLCMYVDGYQHEKCTLSGSRILQAVNKLGEADIAHCHGFRASWYVRALARCIHRSVPVIVTAHGLPGPGAGSWGPEIIRHTEQFLLPVTSRVIVVSTDLGNRLCQEYGVANDIMELIPNGVDVDTFSPGTVTDDRPFTIGFAGRLASEKGIDRLLLALSLGRDAGRDWRLITAGAGPQYQASVQLCRDLGIDHHVSWLGKLPRSAMPAFYRSLDVFALCSRQEGQSIAVLEAMACGIPCVVSDSGGLPEVTGGCAVVVPDGAPEQTAQAIAALEDDQCRRQTLAVQGRQRVSTSYSLSAWAARMAAVYRQAAGAVLMCVLALLILTVADSSVYAGENRIIIIAADGLTVTDIMSLPGLQDIDVGVGLMNVGTGGKRTRAAAWLSVASGARAAAADDCYQFVHADKLLPWGESAADAHVRRTGTEAGSETMVLLDVARIQADNRGITGLLSKWLREAELPLILLGNSDLPGRSCRPVGLFTVGTGGVTDTAVINELSVMDTQAPYGWRLDGKRLLDVIEHSPRPAVIVIDYGDMWRLEDERSQLQPDRYLLLRNNIREAIDRLITGVIAGVQPGDMVIITSFIVPGSSDGLVPLVIFDGAMECILTSPTTRQPGIIANIDIAPTIGERLGFHWQMQGRQVRESGVRSDIGLLARWEQDILAAQNMRTQAVQGYVLAFMIIVGLASGAVYLGVNTWLLLLLKLTLLAAPTVFLTAPVMPGIHHGPGIIVLTIILAGGAMLVSRHRLVPPLVLCSVLLVAIIIDQVLGGYLSIRSVLGYSVISGARYYGLGNELAGILLGTSLMTAATVSGLWQLPDRAWVGIGTAVVVVMLVVAGNPGVGANFGGAISLAVGWSAFALYHVRRSTGLWAVAAVGAAVTAVIVMGCIDAARAPELQSHIGRLLGLVMQGGWREAAAVAVRKAGLNLRLIRYTIWSRVLVAALIGLFILSRRPVGAYYRLISSCPGLGRAVRAATLGAGVGLVVNDSGVVMAATAMIIVTALLGYWLLAQVRTEGCPGSDG